MTKKKYDYDIAIVGGGMVGASLALMLAQKLPNKKLVLLDSEAIENTQSSFQSSFDARSTAVSAQSVDLLKSLNIWQALSEHVTPILKVNVSDQGAFGMTSFTREENNNEALGYVVENSWLGSQLHQQVLKLDNIDHVAPVIVEKIKPMAAAAALRLNNGSEIVTQLVIVADGAKSSLRKNMGINVDVFDYKQRALIANIEFERSHEGVAFERFTANGPLALLPLGESEQAKCSALVWTQPEESYKSLANLDESDFCIALQKAFGHRLGKVVRASTRHVYPLQRIIAKEQARSSVVLMGNAAHFLHPVAGQGFNLALRDSSNLVATLVRANNKNIALGDIGVLLSYVDAQEEDQWLTSGLSHNFNQLFTDPRDYVRLVRNIGLVGLNTFFPAKKLFFNQMMGKGETFSLSREIGE